MDNDIDDERRKIIDSIDWESEYPRFVSFGINYCKKLQMLTNDKTINGNTIEDIVNATILKLISGERNWEYKKVKLEAWIIMTIKSEISNLIVKKSSNYEVDIIDDEYECIEIDTNLNIINEDGYSVDPLKIIVKKEGLETTAKELFEMASEDELVGKMIFAILDGIENKADIMAKYLGVDVKEIYNANKRITRMKKKFLSRD